MEKSSNEERLWCPGEPSASASLSTGSKGLFHDMEDLDKTFTMIGQRPLFKLFGFFASDKVCHHIRESILHDIFDIF